MPRRCYIVLTNQYDDQGFIPSVVTEGESGHQPLTGRGPLAAPWHWGATFEQAKEAAARFNDEDFHLSPDDVATIVASSMVIG